MDQNDQNGAGNEPHATVERSKNRDDTPSFVRDVEARADLLNPDRHAREHLPVLTMPKSVRIWRAARWPLLVFIVLVVLVTVGFITYDLLMARSVERGIAQSQAAEKLGKIKGLGNQSQILFLMAERNPTRANVQAAFAWQAVLQSVLLGPEEEWAKKAKIALDRGADDESGTGWAAKAGFAYLSGDPKKALELAQAGIKVHKDEPRLALVRGWALLALEKDDEARAVLDTAAQTSGGYIPLLITRIRLELDRGNRLEAAAQAEKLIEASPDHLYGLLVAISLYLPDWGGEPISADRVAKLLAEITRKAAEIDDAPPKINLLGQYLRARVNLLAGRFDQAVSAFEKVAATDPRPEVIAWYAEAVKNLRGPESALSFLDGYSSLESPEIRDLRAQCLLVYRRVEAASREIEKLKESGALPGRVKELTWLLDVYSGDVQAAYGSIPRQIGAKFQLPAIELYYLLQARGRRKQINRLLAAFDDSLGSCKRTIEAWHSKSIRRAFKRLNAAKAGDPPCVHALALHHLRGHVPPRRLAEIIQQLDAKTAADMGLKVDVALATWFVAGHAEAVKMLDGVWKSGPEGVPIRRALARAYRSLELPGKALEVLEGVDEPEGLVLRILAAQDARDKALGSSLWAGAVGKDAENPHPALAYLAIKKNYKASNVFDASDGVRDVLHRAGHWTAEIADIGALAYNFLGKRTEADRLLYQTSKQIVGELGIGESLETRFAQIRLSMRRGGKFIFRALFLLNSLKGEGLKDPRLYYHLAMINIHDGNDRMGIRFLRDTVNLDPSYKAAYTELEKLGKLDTETAAKLNKAWPGSAPADVSQPAPGSESPSK
jgi:tetratricopeptide (TPR) repeat protein